MQIVGIDCAVDANGMGLVRALLSDSRVQIAELWTVGKRTAVEAIAEWTRDGGPA